MVGPTHVMMGLACTIRASSRLALPKALVQPLRVFSSRTLLFTPSTPNKTAFLQQINGASSSTTTTTTRTSLLVRFLSTTAEASLKPAASQVIEQSLPGASKLNSKLWEIFMGLVKGVILGSGAMYVTLSVKTFGAELGMDHISKPHFHVGFASAGMGLVSFFVFIFNTHRHEWKKFWGFSSLFSLRGLTMVWSSIVCTSFLLHAIGLATTEMLLEQTQGKASDTHVGVIHLDKTGHAFELPDGHIFLMRKLPETMWEVVKYYFTDDSLWKEEEKEAMILHELGHRETSHAFFMMNSFVTALALKSVLLGRSLPAKALNLCLTPFFLWFAYTGISWAAEFTADMKSGSRGKIMLERLGFGKLIGAEAIELGPGAHPPPEWRSLAFFIGDEWYPIVSGPLKFFSRYLSLRFLYDEIGHASRIPGSNPCSSSVSFGPPEK